MYSFGKLSTQKLEMLHSDLQLILNEAIKVYDFSIICGHRNEAGQNTAFNEKKSKLRWPDSKHNSLPSIAVDIAPYPIDWNNRDRFIFLAGIIYCISQQLGIEIRFGGNWSMDWQFEKQKFDDLVHFELVNPER
jgi:hypothetical protein